METKDVRIEWIDIFKGLAIILVVVGHATGLFSTYIYQFHVAAFFFISGWVAKLDEGSLLIEIYKKVCYNIMYCTMPIGQKAPC